MADTTVYFPGPGSGGATVAIKAADNGDGTFGLSISSALTLSPTNLATSAKQDTAQTSLTAIAAALGTPADAAWTSGNGTLISLLKAIATNTVPP